MNILRASVPARAGIRGMYFMSKIKQLTDAGFFDIDLKRRVPFKIYDGGAYLDLAIKAAKFFAPIRSGTDFATSELAFIRHFANR